MARLWLLWAITVFFFQMLESRWIIMKKRLCSCLVCKKSYFCRWKLKKRSSVLNLSYSRSKQVCGGCMCLCVCVCCLSLCVCVCVCVCVAKCAWVLIKTNTHYLNTSKHCWRTPLWQTLQMMRPTSALVIRLIQCCCFFILKQCLSSFAPIAALLS